MRDGSENEVRYDSDLVESLVSEVAEQGNGGDGDNDDDDDERVRVEGGFEDEARGEKS